MVGAMEHQAVEPGSNPSVVTYFLAGARLVC